MAKYTLKEDPEVVIEVAGKDSLKTRNKAMEKLMDMLHEGKLKTNLDNGFGPEEFIEVNDAAAPTDSAQSEDEVVEAVKILNNLATLKLKVQESQQEALEIRTLVDLLFTDDPISETDVTRLKDGFKVLKDFAQANIRFREARSQAERARAILDRALQQPEPAPAAHPPHNGSRSKGAAAAKE